MPPASWTRLMSAGGITQEKRHDPQAGVEGRLKAAVTVFGENEVAAKRPRGQRRRFPNHGADVFRPRQRQHAERAGIETAAASRGTETMGARTIGCSIPSNSHRLLRLRALRTSVQMIVSYTPSGSFGR